jgi:hypothetical protein
LLGLVACGDDDPMQQEPPIEATVRFNLEVGGLPLILSTLPNYTNSSGTMYSIQLLRFVVTNVTLHDDNGTAFELADLHYYNLADPGSQSFERTGLPHTEWTRVTFTFGLDEIDNVRDKYTSRTAFHNDMQWPVTLGEDLGYHYMQLEGNYTDGPGSTAAYTTHTGPRQLDGTNPDFPGVVDPVPYHFQFDVDLSFTPTHIHNGGSGILTIDFDLNDWYSDNDAGDGVDTEYDFPDYPTQMIMGNLDAQTKLQTNGRFCFSATLEAHGGHH